MTWLSPGILDSAIHPGGHCVSVYGHQPAGRGGLGDDAVPLWLSLHAGAGEVGEVWWPPAVLRHHAACQHLRAG